MCMIYKLNSNIVLAALFNKTYLTDINVAPSIIVKLINLPSHIIDHGFVRYLILQQILLYNQQYAYSTGDNSDRTGANNNEMTSMFTNNTMSTVMMKT